MLTVLGTPHKLICYLIGDMVGMLFFHTKQYNMVYHRMHEQQVRRLTPASRRGECAAHVFNSQTLWNDHHWQISLMRLVTPLAWPEIPCSAAPARFLPGYSLVAASPTRRIEHSARPGQRKQPLQRSYAAWSRARMTR